MELAYSRHGSTGPAIVFFHGLMGRGKNFLTAARGLEGDFQCFLVDLPNHGASPWTDSVSYTQLAQAGAEFIRSTVLPQAGTDSVTLLGHSMGGKTAMVTALEHPELVERLIVEDIAPVPTPDANFAPLLGALADLDLASVDSRAHADAALARAGVDDARVRGFLLQNLRRGTDGWEFQSNVRLLAASTAALSDFPDAQGRSYPGPTLWMGGSESSYITDASDPTMRTLFPRTRRVTVKGAGHWIHADRPEEFLTILRGFLKRTAAH